MSYNNYDLHDRLGVATETVSRLKTTIKQLMEYDAEIDLSDDEYREEANDAWRELEESIEECLEEMEG